MSKINIGKDKILHGFVFGFLALIITSFTGSILAGIIVSVIAGLLKEILDHFTGGVCSKEDMIANIIGAILGACGGYALGVFI